MSMCCLALWFLLCFLIFVFDPAFTQVAAASGISPSFRFPFFQSSWPLSFSFRVQYFSLDNVPPTPCHYFIFTFVVHDVPPQVMYNFRTAVSSWVNYVLHKGRNRGNNGGKSLKSSPLCAAKLSLEERVLVLIDQCNAFFLKKKKEHTVFNLSTLVEGMHFNFRSMLHTCHS